MFTEAVAKDPTRPLLTWYDDGTGDRTELSGATLDNWVSKTANMLVDGVGLGPGDRAAALLPPHWQTAAVLLGCWAAGLSIAAGEGPVDVLFATGERIDEARRWPAGERYVLGLAPMALPMRTPPAGFTDYVVEVRGHGDHFTAYPSSGDSGDELGRRAGSRAAELGIGPGDRVLIDGQAHPDPLDWLLAPLAGGATLVLCGRLDRAKLAERVEAEKVTVRLV
jgi:uncharacterized protein (TIGR03089 family)